jgi:hypothetical protein
VKKRELTDAERVRLRKRIEAEWLSRWRGKMTDPRALLDLWRRWHRHGVIDLATFQLYKREGGFYDNQKQNVEGLKDGTEI